MRIFSLGVYSVLEPLRSISNSVVKRYSGDNTIGDALWEGSTMPRLIYVFIIYVFVEFVIYLSI